MLEDVYNRHSTAPIAGAEHIDIEEWGKSTDALIEKHNANVEVYRREHTIGGEGSRYMSTAWLDFTGWHRHLGELKMDVLR